MADCAAMPSTASRHAADPRPMLMRGRWFAALPTLRQDQLLARAERLVLPAGATLFLRGDDVGGLYGVLSGAVRIGHSSHAGGREQLLGLLEPPQWFGEIALLDGGPRTHDASAVAATTLLHVPRAPLLALAQAEPDWWRLLGQLLAEKVRVLFGSLDEVGALPAPARVARRLLAMAEGHGLLAPGVVQREVRVNQAQLGAMLGLSRQTVSEVLGDLAQRGLVQRRYGLVELLDRPALMQEARLG